MVKFREDSSIFDEGASMKSTKTNAQSILLALKSGVNPPDCHELYRVGRERELAECQRCLDLTASGSGLVKVITGEYGVGKSFFLKDLQRMAQAKRFVVAPLQLNKNFKFNKFEEIYYQIMHNLAVDTSEVTESGFEKMFDLWLKDLQKLSNNQQMGQRIQTITESVHRQHGDFARAFLAYIRGRIRHDQEQTQVAASWIKGETHLPAYLKQVIGVKGQVDRENALEFLAAFIHMSKCLGYSGMLLLVDELDSILTVRADIRQAIYENIRYLIDSCHGGQMPSIMVVFVGTDALLYDQEKGIAQYEPLAQRLGGVSGQPPLGKRDLRQPIMALEPLSLPEITTLTERILALHQGAYGWNPNIAPELLRNWTLFECHKGNAIVLPINTRWYLQKLIRILDIMEQGTTMPISKMKLNLVEKDGSYILKPQR